MTQLFKVIVNLSLFLKIDFEFSIKLKFSYYKLEFERWNDEYDI